MSADESRRFTDREVALVLRRASEIDESEGPGSGKGLTLQDLRDIASEVGISPEAVTKAVASLDGTLGRDGSYLGAPLVQRAVRAVPIDLDPSSVAQLMRLVDERASGAGSVAEALGSVRWTSSASLRSTQVSVTPGPGETVIQVVEKSEPRTRVLLHAIPTFWGGAFGAALLGPLGLAGAGAAGAIVLGAAAGGATGRAIWNLVSRRSRKRVEELAAELAREASSGKTGGSA